MEKSNSTKISQPIHWIFKSSILLYQIFGFMPLDGVFSNDVAELKFSWRSPRTVYSLLTLVGFVFLSTVQLIRLSWFPVQLMEFLRLWYFLGALATAVFFFRLARGWSGFLGKWALVDGGLKRGGIVRGLRRRANITNVIFMGLFVVDYCLIQLQRFSSEAFTSKMFVDLEFWNHSQRDLRFSYVYQLFQYDFVSGIFLFIVQFQVLVAGSLLDVFIILIGECLAARMDQITKKIRTASETDTPTTFWMDMREEYNDLERVCKLINAEIGVAILLSFGGNLGILLIQLFNSFKGKNTAIGMAYLVYVLAHLLIKITAVCLVGSKVNEESKKPLRYLYDVPELTYNVEVERMIRQISRNTMALSGMDFFYIHKNIVLKIAGSIVTYELVLIQFVGDYLKEHEIVNRTIGL